MSSVSGSGMADFDPVCPLPLAGSALPQTPRSPSEENRPREKRHGRISFDGPRVLVDCKKRESTTNEGDAESMHTNRRMGGLLELSYD